MRKILLIMLVLISTVFANNMIVDRIEVRGDFSKSDDKTKEQIEEEFSSYLEIIESRSSISDKSSSTYIEKVKFGDIERFIYQMYKFVTPYDFDVIKKSKMYFDIDVCLILESQDPIVYFTSNISETSKLFAQFIMLIYQHTNLSDKEDKLLKEYPEFKNGRTALYQMLRTLGKDGTVEKLNEMGIELKLR